VSDSTRYPIPAQTTRSELVIGGSRFISTIGEARTADDAHAFINDIKAEFSDATHNVHAFRAGYGASVTEGASDDGEPPGTAGRPALAVLRGEDIGDVVVVITRYFGGQKLGTGGLVRAYTQMTKEAVKSLPLTERVTRRDSLIAVPYSLYEQVKLLIHNIGGEVVDEDFAADVTMHIRFAVDLIEAFEGSLQELSAGRITPEWLEEQN